MNYLNGDKGILIIGESSSGKTVMSEGFMDRYKKPEIIDGRILYGDVDLRKLGIKKDTDCIVVDDADEHAILKVLSWITTGICVDEATNKIIRPMIIASVSMPEVIDTLSDSTAIRRRFKIIETRVVNK